MPLLSLNKSGIFIRVFIIDFEQVSRIASVSLLFVLNKFYKFAGIFWSL